MQNQSNNESEYKRITRIHKYDIQLPSSHFDFELQDLEYQFLTEATPGVQQNFRLYQEDLLNKQFVLVQTFKQQKAILIYNLKKSQQPILRFQESEIDIITFGFFTVVNAQKIVFSLRSKTQMYYIDYNPQSNEIISKPNIKWGDILQIAKFKEAQDKGENKEAPLYKIQDDQRIKIQPLLSSQLSTLAQSKLKCFQPVTIEVNLDDKKEKQFEQTIINYHNYMFELIYPAQPCEKDNDVRQRVQDFLKIYYGHQTSGNQWSDWKQHVYYNNMPYISRKYTEFQKYMKKEHKLRIENIEIVILTQDTIFFYHHQEQCMRVLILKKPQKIFQSFENIKNQIQEIDDLKLQSKIMNNYDWKLNQKIYQDNQLYDKKNDIWRKYYSLNEYLENYYINKKKQDVYTTHCNAFIKEQFFSFPDQYLLIDLNDFSKEPFKLIKLYEDDVKELKLIKYHKSQNCVIFFFIYRKRIRLVDYKEQLGINTNGVHFFVFRTVQQLKSMKENQSLISDGCNIYIPLEINNIIKEKYILKNILKYTGDQLRSLSSSTHLFFEFVRDFGDPTDDWLPFIYHNWVPNTLYPSVSRFDSYFCLFNVEYLAQKAQYQMQEGEEDQIDFSECIQVFKLDFFQGINEKTDYTVSPNYLRNNVITKNELGTRMFQRCTNWQKNIFSSNGEQFSSKFQIGHVNYSVNKTIEIREYLVTIDLKKKIFKNKEQKILNTESLSSNISIIMCQLKSNIMSQQYFEKYATYVSPQIDDNFTLVPKISNNGDINGSYLMINYCMIPYGVLKITKDENIIKKEHPELFHQLKYRLNQYAFIREITSDQNLRIYFSDGETFNKIKISIISLEYYNQIVEIEGSNKSFEELVLNYKPYKFIYDIIEFDNQLKYQNDYHFLQSPICTMGYRSIYFNSQKLQQNTQAMNVILHKDCIQNQYFDKFESTQILYENKKYLITTSLPNFLDFHFEIQKNHFLQFFQPKLILKGQSLFSLAFNSSKFLETLKQALELQVQEEDFHMFLFNSILFHAFKTPVQRSLKNFIKEKTLQINQIDQYFGLMINFLQYETLIQKLLSKNRAKEAQFIIEYLQKVPDPYGHNWNCLMQDLPQILCSTKYNILQFFNEIICEEEESDLGAQALKILPCRFERQLSHPDLPQFGDETQKFLFIQDLDGAFFNDNEVQNKIIYFDSQEVKIIDESKIQVQVQHSFIAFDPIIKKIKIDKILKRESDESIYTDYLDLFEEEPSKIRYMNHLFIANLIDRNQDTNQFMEQSSVKLMIDFQYNITKPIVKSLLTFYILGFYLPYIYVSFIFSSNNDKAQQSYFEIYTLYLLQILTFFTLTIFMIFEYAEMKFNGIEDYFSDSWNYFDSTQYVFFLINIFLSNYLMRYQSQGFYKLINQFLQIMILLLATTRILQYIRYKESFSFLVQMLMAVIFDLAPFLTIFLIFVVVFTFIVVIMEGDIDPEDYEGIPKFMRIMIQIFRNSIGDISIIQYGKWGEESSDPSDLDYERARPFAKFIIWTFWFLNLFFMLIIMLNFLIAEVSQTYDKVKSQGLISIYRQKASLNKLVFQIQHLFGIKHEFRVIAIEQPPPNNQADDEFSTFSVRIKKNTADQILKLKNNLTNIIHQKIDKSAENITINIQKFITDSFSTMAQKNQEFLMKNHEQIQKNFENIEKKVENVSKNVESIKIEHNDLVHNFENQLQLVLNDED